MKLFTFFTFNASVELRSSLKSSVVQSSVVQKENGAFECVMIDDKGFVTEATTSNIWIIKNNVLITRPLGQEILSGVTRIKILEAANDLNITVKLKKFREDDIYKADAVFISNSSALILEAKKLNKKKLNYGKDKTVNLIKHKLFEYI